MFIQYFGYIVLQRNAFFKVFFNLFFFGFAFFYMYVSFLNDWEDLNIFSRFD